MTDPIAYTGDNPYIFVSYAHKDKDIVFPFILALQEKYNVWFDEGIHYGTEWENEIAEKLLQCHAFLFVVTPRSLNSTNCKDEIAMARDNGKDFVNIMVDEKTEKPSWFQLRYNRYQMHFLDRFATPQAAVADLGRKCEWLAAAQKDGAVDTSSTTASAASADTAEPNRQHEAVHNERLLQEFAKEAKIEAGVLVKYKGNKNEVVIPEGIIEIGESAFYGNKKITNITIPYGVTTIGQDAFWGCSALTNITIPASVTTIERTAFGHCSAVTELHVDKNNKTYHSKDNCIIHTASKTLVVGCKTSVIPTDGSVTTIGRGAFNGCSALTNITIPYGVTTIGEGAFANCSALTNISIPNGVTTIGRDAFCYCSALTNITIPYSVTTIGWDAFNYCSGLTELHVDEGNKTYHSKDNCIIHTASKTLVVGCKTSVIPTDGSVTTIGRGAFANCSALTNISIPNGVTTIEDAAFSSCSALTNITIPASVTTIGEWAFWGCWALTTVRYYGTKWSKVFIMPGNEPLREAVGL